MLSVVCLLVLLPCLLLQKVTAVLIYDRQTLLDFHDTMVNFCVCNSGERRFFNPPPKSLLRMDVCCLLDCVFNKKKRYKKRGKRGGVAVCLRRGSGNILKTGSLWSTESSNSIILNVRPHYRCILQPRQSWLLPVFPNSLSPPAIWGSRRPCTSGRGVNICNLRIVDSLTLSKTKSFDQTTRNQPSDSVTVKMALINTRSLANKTFIINYFFASHELDFIFMTETWLNIGELDPLIETSPCDCNFFSSPRTVGRGGGVATIFKKHFNCRSLSVECFASFEVQLCQVDLMYPIFCALIYRPPSYNKLFLKEFSDFLTTIVPNVDRLLILCDFNIHVCCPDKP